MHIFSKSQQKGFSYVVILIIIGAMLITGIIGYLVADYLDGLRRNQVVKEFQDKFNEESANQDTKNESLRLGQEETKTDIIELNKAIGAIPVASGGTGANNTAGARSNLGLVIGTDIPSSTGAGASGTWGIDVTGNARTVTNGLYSTGFYTDPAWLNLTWAHNQLTLGTANGLSLDVPNQQLNLDLASAITTGALSSVDWNTFNNKQNTLVGTTQGDILYYNGTNWVCLDPGTSGQFLSTQGPGANPIWNTISGTISGGGTLNSTVRWGNAGWTENTNLLADNLGNIQVNGNILTLGDINVSTGLIYNIGNVGTDFTSSGGLNLAGDLNIGNNNFTVSSATGNTIIDGTLNVHDNTFLNGDLSINGVVNSGVWNGTAIQSPYIDFGTGANQVSASNIPIIDTGSYFPGVTSNVNATLQSIGLQQNSRYSTGLVSGGTLTDAGGVNVNVAAGSGYVGVKYVTWNATSISMIQDGDNWIRVNNNGIVQVVSAEPDENNYIVLGYIYTVGGNIDIGMLSNNPFNAGNYSYLTNNWVDDSVGSLVDSGNIIYTSGAGLGFNVSGGNINVRLNKYTLGSTSSFNKWYKDASNNWTMDTNNPNQVNTSQYNLLGTGLADMTDSYWKKDVILRTTDGNVHYIYAQSEYPTEPEARDAALPVIPDAIKRSGSVMIADIKVQKGDSDITDNLYDIRPNLERVFGFGTSGTTGTVADHGALAGLSDDDHPQYLLVSGSRAMSGNLSLGGNDLTNVNLLSGPNNGSLTINSVDGYDLNIDSSTTGAINLGTNSNSKTITIGNNTGDTELVFISGTGNINFDNNTLYLDTVNNNVGINTNSPEAKLDVRNLPGQSLDLAGKIQNLNNDVGNNGLLINTVRTANDTYVLDVQSGGTSRFYVQSDGLVGVGTSNPTAHLTVDAGPTTAYDLIKGTGSINSYFQMFIQNQSSGESASSDVVATADTGDETQNYIDMGINSSGYNDPAYNIGGPLDAYLYNNGGDLTIGTQSLGTNLIFHTGGTLSSDERMRIDSSGRVGIATTPAEMLDVNGAIKIGTTANNNTGTIRWNGTNFQGYNGATWKNLDIVNHNDLQNIQGGIADEYYHLTNAQYGNLHSPLTLGTTNGLSLDVFNQQLNLGLASGASNGALSSVDWATFNNKQGALNFSTGLTDNTGTITSNISTGVAGGQTIYGGTAASDGLTIDSTTNATKGNISINPSGGNIYLAGGYGSTGVTISNTGDMQVNGNLTIDGPSGLTGLVTASSGVSVGTGQSYTGAGAVNLSSGAGTALAIDSGTTGAINIGTGANAKTMTLGNASVGSNFVFNSGATGAAPASQPVTYNLNSVTTGNAFIINSTGLGTGGTALKVTGPTDSNGDFNLLNTSYGNTGVLDQARVTIGGGSAGQPITQRDQLYVYGRLNSSWQMYWEDFLGRGYSTTTTPGALTTDGVYKNLIFDEATGTSGSIDVVATAGSSGVAVINNPTSPAANENEWWGTGGVNVTQTSLNPVLEARIQATNNNDQRSLIGFCDIGAGAAWGADANVANNEIFFRKNAADATWTAVTRSAGGAETITATAISTNAFHKLRIEVQNTGTPQVLFYADGNLVATHTTGIPATAFGYYVGNAITAANNRSTYIDYLRCWSDDPPEIVSMPENNDAFDISPVTKSTDPDKKSEENNDNGLHVDQTEQEKNITEQDQGLTDVSNPNVSETLGSSITNQETISGLSLKIDDISSAVGEYKGDIEKVNKQVADFGITLDSISVTLEDYAQRIQNLEEKYQKLEAKYQKLLEKNGTETSYSGTRAAKYLGAFNGPPTASITVVGQPGLVAGDTYKNKTDSKIYFYDGETWTPLN